jgi:hypothetical protein
VQENVRTLAGTARKEGRMRLTLRHSDSLAGSYPSE